MTTPLLAADIVTRISKAVSIPVTVKIRAGKDNQHINCVDFARMMEDSGAAAVTVHGRTWAQGFSGVIDPRHIENVKQGVSIPVLGNGDVFSLEAARTLMEKTGCDGVMIGRQAYHQPWFLTELEREFGAGREAGGLTREDAIRQMLPYIERELAAGAELKHITRHLYRRIDLRFDAVAKTAPIVVQQFRLHTDQY